MVERVRVNGDGSRTLQTHVGKPDLSDSDDPRAWQDGLTIGKDDVFSGMVRLAADVETAPLPAGKSGVLIKIAGVTFGLPLEQAEALIAGVQAAVDDKKAEG